MYNYTIDAMAKQIVKEIGDDKYFDAITKALNEFWSDKISDVWTVDDVMDTFPKLSRSDALDVLLHVHDNFDVSNGINHDVIEMAAEILFPGKTGPLEHCAACGEEIEVDKAESTPSGSMHTECAVEHERNHPEDW